jgi:hypothetical protein
MLLSQNKKMKKSSQNGIHVWNFGIPAFQSKSGLKTCPNATACVSGCYARMGAYAWSNVAQAYEARLAATQSPDFVTIISAEIQAKLKRLKGSDRLVIRVHDSGDFYSADYQLTWYRVASLFPTVQFYAYTKMISQSKSIESSRPVNFRLCFSMGGREDSLIESANDMHARVFESLEALVDAKYADASHDDLVTALGDSNKIGLVYHGVKSYTNTTWNKVKAG